MPKIQSIKKEPRSLHDPKPEHRGLSVRQKEAILALFAILLPFMAAGLGELGLRGWFFLKYHQPGKSYGLWKYDPEFGAVIKENSYNSNSILNNYGYRNREDVFEPKPAGSTRIMAFGGSTTYCYNLDTDHAWPARLEELIRKDPNRSKDQVLNAGVIMWSMGQVARKIRRDVPKLHPDTVLIYVGVNEGWNSLALRQEGRNLVDLVKNKQYGEVGHDLGQNQWLIRNSIFYKVLRTYVLYPLNSWIEKRVPSKYAPVSEEVRQSDLQAQQTNYNETLRETIRFLQEQKVKAVFIPEIGVSNDPRIAELIAISNRAAKVAEKEGATVIDPKPLLQQYRGHERDLFVETGAHFTEQGAAAFSDYVFRTLYPPKK